MLPQTGPLQKSFCNLFLTSATPLADDTLVPPRNPRPQRIFCYNLPDHV
jgi:hypothetical protein